MKTYGNLIHKLFPTKYSPEKHWQEEIMCIVFQLKELHITKGTWW